MKPGYNFLSMKEYSHENLRVALWKDILGTMGNSLFYPV